MIMREGVTTNNPPFQIMTMKFRRNKFPYLIKISNIIDLK